MSQVKLIATNNSASNKDKKINLVAAKENSVAIEIVKKLKKSCHDIENFVTKE